MTKRNRESLRQYFLTGKAPTEGQFADLIDSAINQLDDSVTTDRHGRVGIGAPAPSANLTVRGRLFTPLTGTVSLVAGSADLVGDGTSFDSEVAAGDVIRVGQEVFNVAHVTDATHALLGAPAANSADDAGAYRDVSLLLVENGKGDAQLVVDKSGNVGVGVALPGAKLHVGGRLLASELAGDGQGLTNLQASNIEGTLAPAQLPALTVGQIPDLPASRITEGQLDRQRIPALDASHIPTLDASKITGQLKPEQIPGLPPSSTLAWVGQLEKAVSVGDGGRVGVGAARPWARLEIGGTGGETVLAAAAYSGSTCDVSLTGHVQLRQYGDSKRAFFQARDDSDPSSIGLVLRVQQAGEAGTERYVNAIMINGGGNVGIGVQPPADARLHVAGPLRADQLQGSGSGLTHLQASNLEGTLALAQIPDLPASKITGLQPGNAPLIWAEEVTLYAQGLKLVGRPRATGGVGGFFVGLLQIGHPHQTPAYALGIAFEQRLLSFTSPELTALEKSSGDFKLEVYPERTRLSSPARFVAVEPALAFNMWTPDIQLAAPSRGRIRSVVLLQLTRTLSAADAVALLRRAASSFSFNAVVNPASALPPTQKELAQQLAAEKMLAAEAAPILMAQSPQVASVVSGDQPGDADGFQSVAQFITFMKANFAGSMKSMAQAAWMLGASGIPADNACAAFGQSCRTFSPQAFLGFTLGAFPGPAIQEAVVRLQTEGATAQDAAVKLRALNPAFDGYPVQLGILLRINFHDTADTPLAMAGAWKHAGYPLTNGLTDKLAELFPLSDKAEVASALSQAYGS
jgi:hypothetical protein